MGDVWPDLDLLLRTDPRDVGCEQTWQLIDVYAELVVDGRDPETEFPGITVHLDSCDPCAEDYRGLLEAMRNTAASHRGDKG